MRLIATTTEGQMWAPGEGDPHTHTSCAGPAGMKSHANSMERDVGRLFPDLSFSHASILSKMDDFFYSFLATFMLPKKYIDRPCQVLKNVFPFLHESRQLPPLSLGSRPGDTLGVAWGHIGCGP